MSKPKPIPPKILIKPKQSKNLHWICLAINTSLALNVISLLCLPTLGGFSIFCAAIYQGFSGDPDPSFYIPFYAISIYCLISSIACIILATKNTNLSKHGYSPQYLRSVININLYLAIFSPLALIPNIIFAIFALKIWLPDYETEYANASLANETATSIPDSGSTPAPIVADTSNSVPPSIPPSAPDSSDMPDSSESALTSENFSTTSGHSDST